jgi:hypothetical protein
MPSDAGFAIVKPKLATRMTARAIAASVPFKWVAGDSASIGTIDGYVAGPLALDREPEWRL